MIVDLNEWRVRFTLEALQTLDDKWKAVIAAAVEGRRGHRGGIRQ